MNITNNGISKTSEAEQNLPQLRASRKGSKTISQEYRLYA
jgi:hypothetical protein